MLEIRVNDWLPNQVMDVVRELREKGYVQGIDFDFAYNKPRYDELTHDGVYNRFTIFTFYKDELATWFRLVYE